MSGVLSQLKKRRRYATGGVGMSDPRVYIPERAPNAAKTEPATASLAGPATGRTFHPLDDADYYTYGQTGGEHQFFTGSLPVSPLKPNNLPGGGTAGGGSSGGGGAAGVLGNLVDLAGTAKTAGELANMAGYDNAFTDALKNPVKSAKDAFGNYQLNNNVGSGQYANSALEDAGFGSSWTTPALSGLGAGAASAAGGAGGSGVIASITPEMIDTAIAATSGAGGASAGAGAGAAGSGAGGGGAGAAGGGAGLAAAGPALAAAAIIFGGMNMKDAIDEFGSDAVEKAGFYGMATLPDIAGQSKGKVSEGILAKLKAADQGLRDLGVRELISYRDTGNPLDLGPGYGQGKNLQGRKMQMARGGHSLERGSPGTLHYATQDPKFIGTVKGEGTGRSDEIPARLSDGEYVMDAETVAMLGDGSTDAGARKLDQLRANLRKHKGKNLSKGKFSDNAKDPADYMAAKIRWSK